MLTDKEENLIIALADIWNEFLQLPNEHPCDNQEFCSLIHHAQRMIECRSVRRHMSRKHTGNDGE